jgi:hypothetical protein
MQCESPPRAAAGLVHRSMSPGREGNSMSKQWFRANVIVAAAMAAALCGGGIASAAVPATINYQGFLTDQKTGAPVNANVSVTFALYDAASGGVALYTETQTLAAASGVINAQIGSVTPFPATLAFDKPYWLEIKVGSETLAPRQALASSAYAQAASGIGSFGNGNTKAGDAALRSITTGSNNAAFASYALRANTTGSSNTATGSTALFANSTGSFNTATGQGALAANTTASENTATGASALGSNTTGFDNTATGMNALRSSTTGSNNTATGTAALALNTTGSGNTASGAFALDANTTGDSNTATGQNALFANTIGVSNTATGQNALYANTTGGSNVATGVGAMFLNTTGSGNIAAGAGALLNNTTGSYNVGIGDGGGSAIVGGSFNIDISNPGAASDSGIIRIGDAANSKGTFLHGIQGVTLAKDDGRPVVVSSDGQLATVPGITLTAAGLGFGATTRQMLNLWNTGYGIGVQNNMFYLRTASGFGWYQGGVHSDAWNDPGAGGRRLMGLSEQGLRVVGSAPTGANDITLLADGSIHAINIYGTVLNPSSDRNAKENFSDIDVLDVLARVVALPLQTWNYRSDEQRVAHVGPMAQDFYAAFNVGADDKHIATVDADGVALAAIQGLYHLVEEKDAALNALREQLAAQEETIARLNADRDGLAARVESVEQETRAQLAQLRRAVGTLQQQGAQPVPAVLSH